MSGFYELKAKSLNGQVVSMDKYKGKVVLIENTAILLDSLLQEKKLHKSCLAFMN